MSSPAPPGVKRGWAAPAELLDGRAAALFDCDGTLVDTMGAHLAAWRAALAPAGLCMPAARFYALGGAPAAAVISVLAADQGVAVGPGVVADVVARKAAWVGEDGKDVSGGAKEVKVVAEVLREARKRGMPVGVVSGGERRDVLRSLVAAGVLEDVGEEAVKQVFGAIVTAEDVQKGKPDPEGFLMAARVLGVDPARCVGLEDADLGLQALVSAGMAAADVRFHPEYPLPEEVCIALGVVANEAVSEL
jgi:beta-phosphoglucomutase-like phosphatase (HAD superfamily)